MTKKICVIGGGRWGQNHIRTLNQMGNLAAIVVRNPHKLKQLLEQYPVDGFTSIHQAIEAGFDVLHYESEELTYVSRNEKSKAIIIHGGYSSCYS